MHPLLAQFIWKYHNMCNESYSFFQIIELRNLFYIKWLLMLEELDLLLVSQIIYIWCCLKWKVAIMASQKA